jgi:Helicase conserved C-terminal domain
MGGRFALRFGDDRSDDGGETRRSLVRTAFNSPFWPFVLATTSVGQEGLDFHLYCHAVVHWNLPANPVDLEQREGRVHRYKGHAIRRNLANSLGAEAVRSDSGDPWAWMFEEGSRRRPKRESDIVPYWVYSDGDARIERIVPALPLSRDRSRLEALKRSLVAYRLAFGQPRQEELVAYLREHFSAEEVEELKSELHIDLAPKARG